MPDLSPDDNGPHASLRRSHHLAVHWLNESAYPLWSTRGVDRERGGFHELLNLDGTAPPVPRRARVQPRQVCAFSQSVQLGWKGDAAALAEHGIAYFLRNYRRPDGLFRTLIAGDGKPLDERALLYDQAFALLAFGEAQKVLQDAALLKREADALRGALLRHLKRDGPGFDSDPSRAPPLLSNPHMHLFEACLAWMSVSDDSAWRELADELAALALNRLLEPRLGALYEYFDADWAPISGPRGRILEPGHMFEWAWLLLRWDAVRAREPALRLLQLAERHGVRNGAAINAMLDDFSPHDANARLWPQAERLKAALLAATLTGEPRYWATAAAAASTLLAYLDVPLRGLWRDQLTPQGTFVLEPAPASTFYHIVSAIMELDRAMSSINDR